MDGRKQNLYGSDLNNDFRYWHKQSHPKFYALDADFILVRKYPDAKIVAIIDIKDEFDGLGSITFAEAIAYNELISYGLKVFLVYTRQPFERFTIYQYKGGNWKPEPPEIRISVIMNDGTANDYWKWEQSIREESQ